MTLEELKKALEYINSYGDYTDAPVYVGEVPLGKAEVRQAYYKDSDGNLTRECRIVLTVDKERLTE